MAQKWLELSLDHYRSDYLSPSDSNEYSILPKHKNYTLKMPPIEFIGNGMDATHERTRSKWVRLQSSQGRVIKREKYPWCLWHVREGCYKGNDKDCLVLLIRGLKKWRHERLAHLNCSWDNTFPRTSYSRWRNYSRLFSASMQRK